MGAERVVGVAVELLGALVIAAVGAAAWAGRGRAGRPGRVWELLWGAPPTRVEAVALVVLGLGIAVWALSQAQEGAMALAVAGLVIVVAAGAVMAASALSRPEEESSTSGAAPRDR